SLAQHTEPGEGVFAKVAVGHRASDGGAHDAARAVGANHEFGLDAEGLAICVRTANDGGCRFDALNALNSVLEAQVLAGREAGGDQVDEHLVLRVEPHGAASEARKVDSVAFALEAQL